MSIESRLRGLEKARAAQPKPPLQLIVLNECEDADDLYEFEGKRMTEAEVIAAAVHPAMFCFLPRRDKIEALKAARERRSNTTGQR